MASARREILSSCDSQGVKSIASCGQTVRKSVISSSLLKSIMFPSSPYLQLHSAPCR